MSTILIRNFQIADETDIEMITYCTGFKGEGLEGRDYFNDPRLFYLIFMAYYARYEPQHFFVAEDTSSGKVVGYICGTLDTERKEKNFKRRMLWRIALRALLFTSWRYPKTLLTAVKMARILNEAPALANTEVSLLDQYPAHLHINILPEYQRSGIGSQLIEHFKGHLQCFGIPGVHLGTSSRNHKAIPFYKKHGFEIIQEIPITTHPIFDELTILTFAKTFQ